MNSVIIYQTDPKVYSVLKPLIDLGSGVQSVPNGDKVLVQQLNPLLSPRGRIDSLGQFGFLAILTLANELLKNTQADIVSFQVIFIFHQTSRMGVKGINDTMRLVRDSNILPWLTHHYSKRLNVEIVHLLSCESATDKSVVRPPIEVLQPYVEQSASMRALAAEAFVIPKFPPPEPGDYHPRVVTYTTGNPETGGIVLNPFAVSFRELPGHFNDDGDWVYDDPHGSNHDGDPTGGTIHTSFDSNETTQDIGAGDSINILGFPPP